MPGENSPPQSPSTQRRSSFVSGQKLTEMFGRSPTTGGGASAYPGPIAAAAANAQAHQRRRMSVSALGLSGSPNQTSPFNGSRPRQESYSSNGSSAVDESAIDDSCDASSSAATSPFIRRLSFGARAMRDVRGGQAGSFNGRNSTSAASSQAQPGRGLSSSLESEEEDHFPMKSSNTLNRRTGEGFNWSDQIRSRTERPNSITSSPTSATSATFPPAARAPHNKSASISAPEQPIKEMPKAPRVPDAFQERILKGDFYMD